MPTRKMHADKVETDVALVRRLVADQFPEWAGLPIEPVGERGTDNILYRLGDDLVARLPVRERPELALKKECEWLPKLGPHLPLDVPLPVAVGRPVDGYRYEWAVFRWLQGERATPDRLVDLRRAADDLAGFVAALQSVDTSGAPGPGEHNVYRGGPLHLRDETMRAGIAKLAGDIEAAAVTAIWEQGLAAPDWDRPPVWIHGDLDARNLLVRDGRLSAVLDFGCLGVGDPACEAMVAWKLLDSEGRAIFRSALSIDDATWTRARGWAASQAVGALAYYTLETNAALVLQARRWLAELVG